MGVNQDCWWFSSSNPGFRCQCSSVSSYVRPPDTWHPTPETRPSNSDGK